MMTRGTQARPSSFAASSFAADPLTAKAFRPLFPPNAPLVPAAFAPPRALAGQRGARVGADQPPWLVGYPGEHDGGAMGAGQLEAAADRVHVAREAAAPEVRRPDAKLAQPGPGALFCPRRGVDDLERAGERRRRRLVHGQEGDLRVDLPRPELAGEVFH